MMNYTSVQDTGTAPTQHQHADTTDTTFTTYTTVAWGPREDSECVDSGNYAITTEEKPLIIRRVFYMSPQHIKHPFKSRGSTIHKPGPGWALFKN